MLAGIGMKGDKPSLRKANLKNDKLSNQYHQGNSVPNVKLLPQCFAHIFILNTTFCPSR